MTDLTPRQRQVLEFIDLQVRERGYPPSVREIGEAVGLTPLVVLLSVTATGVLFGGFAVILAIPLAAVATTLVDVIVRDKDPAEEEVPTVLFSAKDAEA